MNTTKALGGFVRHRAVRTFWSRIKANALTLAVYSGLSLVFLSLLLQLVMAYVLLIDLPFFIMRMVALIIATLDIT